MSAIEALCNAIVGLAVSWLVTYYALPWWGLEPSPSAATGITLFYFTASFLRSWAIREVFRRVCR